MHIKFSEAVSRAHELLAIDPVAQPVCYDAVFVALAELLDTTLLTCDARLARGPGLAKRVELIQ